MEKTYIITKSFDAQHGDWQKGEIGYIDGYVRGGNDIPYAAVVINRRIVLINFHSIDVISSEEYQYFRTLDEEEIMKEYFKIPT